MEAKAKNPKGGAITNCMDQLPQAKWWGDIDLYLWEGFWYSRNDLESVFNARSNFQACNSDVFLASSMKVGSNWLKALITCIFKQPRYKDILSNVDAYVYDDPLIKHTPYDLVPRLEVQVYSGNSNPADLSSMPSPRLFCTHMPYKALPESVKTSNCKIVYIVRDPKDTFVSLWHFMNSFRKPEFPMEEAFESFCNGVHSFGPFFDHALEYWKESVKNPEKILFLKYEEMKVLDPKGQVKRLASFLGRPFVNEQEVDKVLDSCSIERLKNLDVNKNGSLHGVIPNSAFFRLGIVGDWKNYYVPEMKERLDSICKMKLEGSGLNLDL